MGTVFVRNFSKSYKEFMENRIAKIKKSESNLKNIEFSMKGRIAYVLKETDNSVDIFVVILKRDKNEMGYKDISISDGPYYYDCPKKYIDYYINYYNQNNLNISEFAQDYINNWNKLKAKENEKRKNKNLFVKFIQSKIDENAKILIEIDGSDYEGCHFVFDNFFNKSKDFIFAYLGTQRYKIHVSRIKDYYLKGQKNA